LIETDAEAAIGEAAKHFGGGQVGAGRGVEHDEVVAQALHLGERKAHGTSIRQSEAALYLGATS
jgi:hypothetical protein